MTVMGLMADLGYVTVEAAARFSLIHRWAEFAAFLTVGVAAMWLAVAAALAEVRRMGRRG
jgi:uncharacterized membrane protein